MLFLQCRGRDGRKDPTTCPFFNTRPAFVVGESKFLNSNFRPKIRACHLLYNSLTFFLFALDVKGTNL